MSFAENLPEPVITPVSEHEMIKINLEIDSYVINKDYENAAKMVNIFPLSASVLDDLKKHYGIEFLLNNKVNLYNAIKTYGMGWLER